MQLLADLPDGGGRHGAVCQCMDGLKAGEADAYEKLMYALLLSGLAMQMTGNSRPASCAEHHVSHLWEMEVINDHVWRE